MPKVARRRVHVASVLAHKKPLVIKRKTVLPRDVMEERVMSIARTHLHPMELQNLQDNLRKASDEKVEGLYKYWSKQGKKKAEKPVFPQKPKLSTTQKWFVKYHQIPYLKKRLEKVGRGTAEGVAISFQIAKLQEGGWDESTEGAYQSWKKERETKGKEPQIPPKPKSQPVKIGKNPKPKTRMTHIERMHLLATCKKFELDPQEIDNTLNYYENKKHLQELASEKGFSEAEITSGEQEQEEWVSQFKSYLNQLKGELESAGYQVREATSL